MKFGFFQPNQLAWLALIPLVVFFYLMKLTRRERPVSALFLWQLAASQARVDSFWQRLRHNLFLWLQLLLLLLLALALARPYQVKPGLLPRQVALVLDQSASMAIRTGSTTRFELARQKLREMVRQAPSGTEFLLAGLTQRPRIYLPFQSDRDKVLKTLESLDWEAVEADPASLTPLVLSLTRSNPNCEVLFLSDHEVPGLPARYYDCSGGTPVRNLAVASFQIEEEDGHLRAFVDIRSFSSQGEQPVLTILDKDGKVVLNRTLLLAAQGEKTLTLDLPQLEPPLQARLEGGDDLAIDDAAWSLPPQQRTSRVRIRGTISPFLQQALLAQEGIQILSPDSRQTPSCEVWGEFPRSVPSGNHIFETGGAKSPDVALRAASAGPLAALTGSELWAAGLAHLSNAEMQGMQPTPWLESLDGKSALLQLKDSQRNCLVFTFPLETSNLPLTPVLPIALARFLDSTRNHLLQDFPRQVNCGQELSWKLNGTLQLQPPRSSQVELTDVDGEIRYTPVRPGVYRILKDKEELIWVANFFSPQECGATAVPGATPGGAAETPGSRPAERQPFAYEYWRWAVAIVIVLALLEWYIYWSPRRRA